MKIENPLAPVLFVSLAIAVVGVNILALTTPAYFPWALAILIYATLVWALRVHGEGVQWVDNLLLTLTVFTLLVLTPEILFRVAGFRHEIGVQFGYPRPTSFRYYEPDDDLFWRLPADAPERNRFGFQGPDVPTQKEENRFRIAFLGDSVMVQGYPALISPMLEARPELRHHFEAVTLALTGYSSHQGRVLAARHGAELEADLVVVAYGWNDHWLAWGEPDADKQVREPRSALARTAWWVYHRSRLTQATRYVLTPLFGRERPSAQLRVPAAAYRANLEAIGERFAAEGTAVLLLTVPSAHPHLGVPNYLMEHGFARDAASVLDLHRHYNDIVRQVATTRSWYLCDLEAEFAMLSDPGALFLEDGIHLTEDGLTAVAIRLAVAIAILPEARGTRVAPSDENETEAPAES